MIVQNKRAIQRPPGIVHSATLTGTTPTGNGSGSLESKALNILKLVRHADGKPSISLSIVLERQPQPRENIRTLIESGVLAFELQLATQEESQNRLFTRQVSYELHWEKENHRKKLANSMSSGTEARVALSVNLSREQTLDALAAFQNQPAGFYITAGVQYREEGQFTPIRLRGSWAAIYQFVKLHCNNNGQITETTLQSIIPSMISKNLVTATDDNGLAKTIPSDILIRLVIRQASTILKQTTNFNNGGITYTLRTAPHTSFQLDYRENVKLSTLKTLELKAVLHDLVADALLVSSLENHIFLVAHKPNDPSRVAPVARKVTVSRRSRMDAGMDVVKTNTLQVAAIDNKLTSVSLTTKPSTNTATYIKPQLTPVYNAGLLDYFSINLDDDVKPESLPVVASPSAPYWLDRLYSQKAWYAPEFDVILPQLNTDPIQSPFLFSYETNGVTNTGKPALNGTFRFSLVPKMPQETIDALAASGVKYAEALPLDSLVLNVLLPFVDEIDGQMKQHLLSATITSDEEKITAEVEVLNDWVRLMYGALAVEGFQSLPVQVQITFTFRCYTRIKTSDLNVIFGGKTLETPVLYNASEITTPNRSEYLDASTLTYVQPLYQLQFQPEVPNMQKNIMARSEPLPVTLMTAKPIQYQSPITPINPQVVLKPELSDSIVKVEYAEQIQVVQRILPLLYPCNIYGNFYQDRKAGIAIGCQDALKLGEIKYRQYEEIIELRDDDYFQVHRSLSQPGHFILVPVHFCISRKEVDEPDAYRPLLFLNSLIDVITPDNNKVELRTTLQPDIPVFRRLQIMEKLKEYHPSPTISYSIDVPNDNVVFNWEFDQDIFTTCETDLNDASGPFISAYFSMNLPNWELLYSVLQSPGLKGSVEINLTDGTTFISNLFLRLDKIRGPWINGPLQLSAANGQITITNKTESTVEVSDLVRYAGSYIAEEIPVEVSLAEEEIYTTNGPEGLVPVYSYLASDPVAIEETRSFVEDIYGNIAFINLVTFINHDLLQLNVEAKVRGIEGVYNFILTDVERIIEFNYILPLTVYLQTHIVDFRITKIFNNQEPALTEWMEWDFGRRGIAVSITSDILLL